jgi:hypothetical protein
MAKDGILEALEQQVGCYQKLAKLAEIQHDHVRNSRIEDLLKVLGQRQEVLDVVADLEQSIGPAKRRWSDYLGELPEPDRGRAENLLGQTRRLLEQITTADKNDALVLQQRKLNIGKEIGQATAARRINRTYAAAAYGRAPSKMDIKR